MTGRRRAVRAMAAAVALLVALGAWPSAAAAHPLGNFTSNRAVVVSVGATIDVTAILDLAEIPAYEVVRELDEDGDDAVSPDEGRAWADATCATWRTNLETTVDGAPVEPTAAGDPTLSFPPGAGGLATLRLECPSSVAVDGPGPHRLTIRDATTDERIGWREVVVLASEGAAVTESDVPATSPSAFLTSYPEAQLESPSDVRSATALVRLAPGTDGGAAPAAPAGEAPATTDPLASIIGGELSPGIVLLAFLLSVGLGAAHALSPGHGKTLVAAYVLGAGGSARAAMRIGLWVAISHTAGVFVLGVVTLAASQWLLPERLIAWLSLGSGVVVTGLGLVLLLRVLRARGFFSRHRTDRGQDHDHDHGHDHGHDHDHGHSHPHAAPDGELSWRSAIALGFAGGAVPSASALIVLLVALSTDRLLLGTLLIGAFGVGMAAVLGGLAFAIARVRRLAVDAGTHGSSPLVRRSLALAPVVAGVAVLVTGLAFTVAAVNGLG